MLGPFATATELSELTGTTPAAADLARWQAVLQSAADLMRSSRGQTLSYVTDESVTFLGTNEPNLWLWDIPVVSITSVTENGVLLAGTAWENTTYGAVFHTTTAGQPTGIGWPNGATVVYSHGYQPTDPEFGGLRTMNMRIAARALLAPELTQGLVPVEAVGWAPQVFLTEQDHAELMNFGAVAVG